MKSVKHSITHASGLNYSELNGTRMLTGRHCHMYINLFVARLHLLSLGCSPPTKSLLGLFGALVQSGRADNISPVRRGINLIYSSITRTYYPAAAS
jgi:hypothetical protein